MAPIDITKPEIINFLIESYEKTARLRMRWCESNKDKLKHTATFRGPERGYTEETTAKLLAEIGIDALARDHVTTMPNRKRKPYRDSITMACTENLLKGHSLTDIGLGDSKDDPRLAKPDTDLSNDPIMRPVPPEQMQIIHDGLPYFGRLEYLKVRNRIKPEDKYYFQETMGWAYGWRLQDSVFGKQAPSYGRVAKLSKSMNRSGPQPDPQDPCDLL
ncbi:hypothetical protein NE865_00694 [Phthorimaea operculella]|nr:hypothetical protein NE865_00694 [Phthorimaea operculella]